MNLLRIGRIWILPLQATGTNLLQILPDQDPTCRGYRYVFITDSALDPTCTGYWYVFIIDSARSGSYFYRLPVRNNFGFGRIRIIPRVPNGILLRTIFSGNRDETNFAVTRNKVIISRNSMLHGMATFVLRNGTKRNEMKQKSNIFTE
jgi:hypothetical protein